MQADTTFQPLIFDAFGGCDQEIVAFLKKVTDIWARKGESLSVTGQTVWSSSRPAGGSWSSSSWATWPSSNPGSCHRDTGGGLPAWYLVTCVPDNLHLLT